MGAACSSETFLPMSKTLRRCSRPLGFQTAYSVPYHIFKLVTTLKSPCIHFIALLKLVLFLLEDNSPNKFQR